MQRAGIYKVPFAGAEGILAALDAEEGFAALHKRRFKLVVPVPRLNAFAKVVFIAGDRKFAVAFRNEFHFAEIYC